MEEPGESDSHPWVEQKMAGALAVVQSFPSLGQEGDPSLCGSGGSAH